jgi:hypothetical protein
MKVTKTYQRNQMHQDRVANLTRKLTQFAKGIVSTASTTARLARDIRSLDCTTLSAQARWFGTTLIARWLGTTLIARWFDSTTLRHLDGLVDLVSRKNASMYGSSNTERATVRTAETKE